LHLRRAHEVSTSKQHKSISASDVFKALELIEFADLIPPLQAELQGTPSSHSVPLPTPQHHLTVYRELSKSKKGSTVGGASGSAPPARSKTGGSSSAAPRGKGKERAADSADSHISAPLPGALGALSLDPQPQPCRSMHLMLMQTHAVAEMEPELDVGEGDGVKAVELGRRRGRRVWMRMG
jgi:hypothetical protein